MKNTDCIFDTISLSIYTPDEIRKLAVKEIKNYLSIEPTLNTGAVNGLYDSQLGSINDREPCRNCNLPFYECNGHFGRIEFPKVIYNPALFGILFKFVKGMCFYCHKLRNCQGISEALFSLGLKELESDIKRFNDVEELLSLPIEARVDRAMKCLSAPNKDNACDNCHKKKLIFNKSRKAEILVHIAQKKSQSNQEEPDAKRQKINKCEISMDNMEKPIMNDRFESQYSTKDLYSIFTKEENVIMPEIVREHLRYLWINECQKLKVILPFLSSSNFQYPTDAFFMENMLINPPMNRLPAMMNGVNMSEGAETANFSQVVKSSLSLRSIMNNRQPELTDAQFMQNIREGILDLQQRVNTCLDAGTHKNLKFTQPGLRQKIDKKAGLFRMNIMAKRVNFACRSVISPDPNIGLEEIGVPVIFLKRLTFSENMNQLNKDLLRQYIINGPDVFPGANSYKIDEKPVMTLKDKREEAANYIESMYQRGCYVTVFRHAMDGDYMIMNRQPTLHKPSMQAHKIRAIHDPLAKTLRMHYSNCKAYNADFDGDEMNGHFMQSIVSQTEAKTIVSCAHQHSTPKDGSPLSGLIQDHVIAGTKMCMRDAFLERHEYYDLVKAGLRDNYVSPMKILPPAIVLPKRLWTGKQVLSTILINSIPVGNKLPNIVLHEPKKNVLWSTTERETALQLSDVDLVIMDGYVCTGIFDKVHIGPSQKGLVADLRELYGNESVLQILTNLSRCLNRYLIYTGFSTNMKDGFLNKSGDSVRENISAKIKSVGLTSIAQAFKLTPDNLRLDEVVRLMAKAQFDKSDDFKTKMQEIDVNFKCLSNKYLNELGMYCKDNLRQSFPLNNLSFMSQTGAKGGESNVKKIAVALGAIEIEGKRTPITVSGKTLPSFVRYDFDPLSRGFCMSRFTTGLYPQELFFESMAGRDGLVDTAVKTSSSGYLQRCLIKQLEDITVKYDATVRDNADNIIQFKYGYDGLDVIKSMATSNVDNMEVICRNLGHFDHKYVHKSRGRPVKIADDALKKSDLIKINDLVAKMAKQEQMTMTESDIDLLKKIVAVKLMVSVCEPGEPVGLLASQSIGEPSTQMTLNTFHNAGQSEMNVTLGIPRLREILMTGSENIKTPSMSIPILPNSPIAIESVIKDFNKLRMKDVIQFPMKLEVNEYHTITFKLKKSEDFKNLTNLNLNQILVKIENNFLKQLAKTLKNKIESATIDIKIGSADDKEDNEEKAEDHAEVDEEEEKPVPKKRKSDDDKDSDNDDDDDDESDSSETESSDKDGSENEDENDNMEDDEAMESKKTILMDKYEDRKKNVIGMSQYFLNYEIDQKKKPRWIKLTLQLMNARIDLNSLLMSLIQSSVIADTKGISKAITMKTKKGDFFCTEGYNHLELMKYDTLFDLNKFNTNNIVKIAKLYGIEAAVSSIEHEIKKVFEPYSIDVSSRHLRLIADQMTFHGHSGAFNRHSMKFHSSQLQRSSFETALDTWTDMLYKATDDSLRSPTANLLMGQVVSNIGSNAMELLFDRNIVNKK